MLLAVLNCIFFVSVVTAEPRIKCGTNTYDPSTEKCCGSTISSIGSVWRPRCCKSIFYDESKEKCCQGTVGNIESMDHPDCCGSQVYDMSTERCCQDVVYDPTTHECQDGTSVAALQASISIDNALEKCGKSQMYLPSEQKCCSRTLNDISGYNSPKCCSAEAYDSGVEICCGQILTRLGPDNFAHPGCCGGNVFDRASKMCCKGVLSDISQMDLPKCCGSSTYDSATHDCVDSVVVSKEEANEGQGGGCPLGDDWTKANDDLCFIAYPTFGASYPQAVTHCSHLSTDQIQVRLLQVKDAEDVIAMLPEGDNHFYRLDGAWTPEVNDWANWVGEPLVCTSETRCGPNGTPFAEVREPGKTIMYNPYDGKIIGDVDMTRPYPLICASPAA